MEVYSLSLALDKIIITTLVNTEDQLGIVVACGNIDLCKEQLVASLMYVKGHCWANIGVCLFWYLCGELIPKHFM